MLFGFLQYPFPAKKQPILRTAHTKSAVFSVKVSGFPVHARESRRYFHCPIFSKRFIDKLRTPQARGPVFALGSGGDRAFAPQIALRVGTDRKTEPAQVRFDAGRPLHPLNLRPFAGFLAKERFARHARIPLRAGQRAGRTALHADRTTSAAALRRGGVRWQRRVG